VTVICPGDLVEAEEATKAIAAHPGTCYLRLGRGGEKRVHDQIEDFKIGKAIKIRDCIEAEKRVAIFSTGAILDDATDAADMLEQLGIGVEQYSFPTVKPLDTEVVCDCAERFDHIVTVEEHNIVGGFGGAVAEVLAESPARAKLVRIGLDDQYCTIVGNQQYLREKYGMSAEQIVKRVQKVI